MPSYSSRSGSLSSKKGVRWDSTSDESYGVRTKRSAPRAPTPPRSPQYTSELSSPPETFFRASLNRLVSPPAMVYKSIPHLVPSQPYVTIPAPQWLTDIRTTPTTAHNHTCVQNPSAVSSSSSFPSHASRPPHVHAAANVTSPSASFVPPPAPRLVLAELPPLDDAPCMTPSPLLAELKVDLAWDVLDGLDISVAEEPATHPPCYSEMILRAEGFPWTVTIPSSARAISIGDIIQAIHGSLRVVVQERELVKCNEQPRKDVRRIYFLRKKTVFVGLESYREPDIWTFRVEHPHDMISGN